MSDTLPNEQCRREAGRAFIMFLLSYGALALFAVVIVTFIAAALTAGWSAFGI